MRAAVVLLPRGGVGEPEVGATVDDDGGLRQLLRDLGRLPVRKAQEDDVVPEQFLDVGGTEDAIGQRQQVGMV